MILKEMNQIKNDVLVVFKCASLHLNAPVAVIFKASLLNNVRAVVFDYCCLSLRTEHDAYNGQFYMGISRDPQ